MCLVDIFFRKFYTDFKELDSKNTGYKALDSKDLNSPFLNSLPLELKALILATNNENIELFNTSEVFKEIYKKCLLESKNYSEDSKGTESKKLDSKQTIEFNDPTAKSYHIASLKLLQKHILESLTSTEFRGLKEHILRLNAVEILSAYRARGLIDFFTQSAKSMESSEIKNTKEINLKSLRDELDSIHKRLVELHLSSEFYMSATRIQRNIHTNKFSIGVTGVLSAGKSTFLNALLGSQILGSSTIPETASLTILKYDERQRVVVYFWNTSQWEQLIESSKYDKALQRFVEQSMAIFKDSLSEYILSDSKKLEISIEELSRYTSANDKSKLCNLVREVRVFTPLKFLENGVEIVDTPGLDDPVIKREEITRGYIFHCDLLIHVMNASCAATQIDIDFILESLLSRNISRLLIILTRIDLISPSDLEKSLEYTKSSLESQLKRSQISDIDSLLSRIDFIPVSSHVALMSRMGGALESSYTLETCGILEVEKYLAKMLLGENSLKQKDILYLAYRAFLKICKGEREELEIESRILNANDESLESLLSALKLESEKLIKWLDSKQAELDSKLEELESFLESLQNFVEKSLKKEQEKIQNRIYEDAIYEYDRGSKPARERLDEMLSQGFKDCFSDLSREYQYKISQRINVMVESSLDSKEGLESGGFDSEGLDSLDSEDSKNIESSQVLAPPRFDFSAPKEEINKMLILLQDSIYRIISSHSKSSVHEIPARLDSEFSSHFEGFNNIIKHKNKDIESKMLEYFKGIMLRQKEAINHQIAKKQEAINIALERRKNANNLGLKDAIDAKQKELKDIINELEYVKNVLG